MLRKKDILYSRDKRESVCGGNFLYCNKLLKICLAIIILESVAFVFVMFKSGFIVKIGEKLGFVEYSIPIDEQYLLRGWERSIKYNQADVVFLGDSITCQGEWEMYFKNQKISCIAVPGDSIEKVGQKVKIVLSQNPQKIFLMVGVNNLLSNDYVNMITKGYEMIITDIQSQSNAEIYIQSILPTRTPSKIDNERVEISNEIIQTIAEKYNCNYVNLYDEFIDEKGELVLEYSKDGVHINDLGYERWALMINDLVN